MDFVIPKRFGSFKFLSTQDKDDEVASLVHKAWGDFFEGTLSYIWESKLKYFKLNLKENKKLNISQAISSCQEALKNLQEKMEVNNITTKLLSRENELEEKIQKLERKEEHECRRRSRISWLKLVTKTLNIFTIIIRK